MAHCEVQKLLQMVFVREERPGSEIGVLGSAFSWQNLAFFSMRHINIYDRLVRSCEDIFVVPRTSTIFGTFN